MVDVIFHYGVKKTKVCFLRGATMTREDGEQRPYREPFEPVGIEDWELDPEDNTATLGGDA